MVAKAKPALRDKSAMSEFERDLDGSPRHDWTLGEVQALFAWPFMDLILAAQRVHRAHHAANTVQMSTLLSIKTGACPEDCAYCPQSVRYDTGIEREALMDLDSVRAAGGGPGVD